MFESLPMHDGAMSCYTACAITLLVCAGGVFSRYNANEFRRVEQWVNGEFAKVKSAIGEHDDYIDKTNDVINRIHVDLAVQKTSMKELKDDITEIKRDIKVLLKR